MAKEFDFPNASRFHRAFYFATNSTPREFKNTIIRLALTDPAELEYTLAHYASLIVGSDAVLHRDVQFIPLKPKAEETAYWTELKYPIVLYKNPLNNAALAQAYLRRFQKRRQSATPDVA